MVASVSTTLNPKSVAQSQRVPHSHNPTRPPLLPSDPDNGAVARRPKSREVTSRYLSSSTSSNSASVLRRCLSPSVSGTSTSATVLTPMPSSIRRSEFMERTQIGTPHPNSLDFRFVHGNGRGEMTAAQKLLFNSTRSLSASFQGESFPLQASKAKPARTPGIRKGMSEQRKTTTPTKGTGGGGDQTENMKPVDQQRWHGSHRQANCMSRSLDCMDERKKVAGGSGNVVRTLQNSFVEDRSTFDGRLGSDSGNLESERAVEPLAEGTSDNSSDVSSKHLPSDSESVSSSCSSGTQEGGAGKGQRGPRVVVVQARVWQETNNRLRRQPEPGSPLSKNVGAKSKVPSKKVAGGSGNVVRALQNSFVEDRSTFEGRLGSDSGNLESERAVEPLAEGTSDNSSDVSSKHLPSDSESVSSSCSSGTQEGGAGKGQRGPRVVVVQARVWQETNNRLRRQPEPGSPLSKNVGAKSKVPSKVNIPKKHSIDSPASSPRQVANNYLGHSSPVRSPIGPASPSKLLASSISSPSKGSPSHLRCSVTNGFSNYWSSTPSALSFANDVRRGKMWDSRMVDVHSLKILYNRLLQWRFVNARADVTSSVQSLNAEKNIFSAWNGISKLRESVLAKRHELQLLQHKLRLASILKSQMTCLDELDLLDQDFSSSLSGITEALEARTLRLPVDDGAKAEVQDVKEAISSAVDVMQAMAPSLSLWLSKVGDVNSVVSKLADVNAHERALLDQCNDLLSTASSMQVKEFSLRTHILQLERISA